LAARYAKAWGPARGAGRHGQPVLPPPAKKFWTRWTYRRATATTRSRGRRTRWPA